MLPHFLRLALAIATLVPAGIGAQAAPTFDPARLLADVQAYYAFGVHRTAHQGDLATSTWLARRFRDAGLETSEHEFSLRQFFLDEAWIDDGRGRIEAFPVWLPRATPLA